MKVYLVGGAVRDRLLGWPVAERDYVVVGSTPDEMLNRGFLRVGKAFPVFLHPETKEEYALARSHRRIGHNRTHPGVRPNTDHTVSLEEDLQRRDLTINALAEDEQGRLIDYYGGMEDLKHRVLRHISPAFADDPLRILRVGRFAARYAELGFRVANDTMALMRRMVKAGDVDTLTAERVWQETAKALSEAAPVRFFDVLRECGALERLFPEIERLWGVPQPQQWHPEIDTGVHTMMVLEQAARLSPLPEIRFAALTHDLGKGLTPRENWPSHRGHEQSGVRLIRELCMRLRIPNRFKDLACLTAQYHSHVHHALTLRPSSVLNVLERTDAFRRPERFDQFLLACEADHRGRRGFETRHYPQAELFRNWFRATSAVDLTATTLTTRHPDQVRKLVRKLRLAAIRAV